MSDNTQFGVVIERPGHDPIHIGPLPFKDLAEDQAAQFRQMLSGTQHVEGTTIDVAPYDPNAPGTHLVSVPTTAHSLAACIDHERPADGTGLNFPDLFSRLHAQIGYAEAAALWSAACAEIDDEPAETEIDELATLRAEVAKLRESLLNAHTINGRLLVDMEEIRQARDGYLAALDTHVARHTRLLALSDQLAAEATALGSRRRGTRALNLQEMNGRLAEALAGPNDGEGQAGDE